MLQKGKWNCSDQEGGVEITNHEPKNRETLSFLPGPQSMRLEREKEMQLVVSGDRWRAKSPGSDLNTTASLLHAKHSSPSHSLGCSIPARHQAQTAPTWEEASSSTDEGWSLDPHERLALADWHWALLWNWSLQLIEQLWLSVCISGSRAEAACQHDVQQQQHDALGHWKSGCKHEGYPTGLSLSCHVTDSYAYCLYQFALQSHSLEVLAPSVTLCLHWEQGKVVAFLLPKLVCSFKLPKVLTLWETLAKG